MTALGKRLGRSRSEKGIHLLRDRSGTFKKHPCVIFFDSETIPDENHYHHSFMSTAILRRIDKKGEASYSEYTFDKGGSELVSVILDNLSTRSDRRRILLLAHNTDFDSRAMGVPGQLLSEGFEMDYRKSIFTESSRPFFLSFRREIRRYKERGKERVEYQRVELSDLGNYFTVPLSTLGKQLGFPKTEFAFHDNPSPEADDFGRSRRAAANRDSPEWKECSAYCLNDTRVVRAAYEALEDFMEANELGPLKSTIASTALNVYLRKFYKPETNPIQLHDSPELFALEEKAYAGGAVLARRIIDPPESFLGKQVDFVSMYASVMHDERMPTKVLRYTPPQFPQPSQEALLNAFQEGHSAIATVRLNIESSFGAARYPLRTESTLLFPTGTFVTTLAGIELERALRQNEVTDILEVCLYETADLFSGYIEFFGGKKIEYARSGDKPFETLAKLFSNSLYGKWAQTIEKFDSAVTEEIDEDILEIATCALNLSNKKYLSIADANGEPIHVKSIDGVVMVSNGWREASSHTNMAIAAHITSYARQRLFDAAEIAGWSHVVYCDTDSWIVDEEGFANLEKSRCIGTAFGQLTPEVDIRSIEICGLKHYRIEGFVWNKSLNGFDYTGPYEKKRHKGISEKAVLTERGTYIQPKFERFHPVATNLNRSLNDGVLVTMVEKTAKAGIYQKGYVSKNGTVTPYHYVNGDRQ